MEQWKIQRGADNVINHWVKAYKGSRICIVTSHVHEAECRMMEKAALEKGASVKMMIVEGDGIHVGDYFDAHPHIFDAYDIIIGAADYSIITTRAADVAIVGGKKLLSLPLSTNNG